MCVFFSIVFLYHVGCKITTHRCMDDRGLDFHRIVYLLHTMEKELNEKNTKKNKIKSIVLAIS